MATMDIIKEDWNIEHQNDYLLNFNEKFKKLLFLMTIKSVRMIDPV